MICGEGPVRRAIEFARLLEPLGVVPSLADTSYAARAPKSAEPPARERGRA